MNSTYGWLYQKYAYPLLEKQREKAREEMKALCREAGVSAGKVFPHNLRHLFARTYYNMKKDIAKLADILGHSSINTTRIYIISTGREHQRQIGRLGLVL